jgi:hypothetical protein
MPCWEVQTTNVSLEASDRGLLRDALMRLAGEGRLAGLVTNGEILSGYVGHSGVRIDLATGQLTVNAWQRTGGPSEAARVRNVIQKAYAHEVVQAAANEFGLTLEPGETADEYLTAGL